MLGSSNLEILIILEDACVPDVARQVFLLRKKKEVLVIPVLLVKFELKFYTKIQIDIVFKIAAMAARADDFRINKPTLLYQYAHKLLC